MDQTKKNTFVSASGFCPECGTCLPALRPKGDVTCYGCAQEFKASVFGKQKVEFVVQCTSIDRFLKNRNPDENDSDGPVVKRDCPKCGNDEMSYATIQLRSADEGQTVFYKCVKCKYKESENS